MALAVLIFSEGFDQHHLLSELPFKAVYFHARTQCNVMLDVLVAYHLSFQQPVFPIRILERVQAFLPLLTIEIFIIFPPSYVVSATVTELL